ncbi:DNA modification methylase [Luteibacter sp. UNC138MFCol5.1]|uniref:DNA-methyltransferase n=1 Tax=Luteibacter sp. UNC138MFCol5.1 TaxID=1502774 RepID=UPI0008CDA989|nr:site-specific DNA-methyltransferase [Luteibacter sp. UNC138MFCol5.1]SEO77047.1 DNA modification methylase [Luteibacter sp. UNC138MFCol5.1]
MTVSIITGDCRDVLRTLPEASAHTCVTSPPYFGLRDYGVDGQIGLEPSPEEFVAELVAVFREVRRVLRDDGTLWLNLGDSYAGSWGAQSRGNTAGEASSKLEGSSMLEARRISAYPLGTSGTGSLKRTPGLKPKDLIGIPWRVALALQADGWYLRQDIIWHKPNPMPESVRDRCTKAHEYLFLLSKSERYYFDQAAISEELEPSSVARLAQNVDAQIGSERVPGKTNGTMRAVGGSRRNSFARETKASAGDHGQKPQHRLDRDDVDYTGRRNRRSVWTVATQPFKEAHFATFPPDLIEPCILAGTPAGGVVLDPFGGAGTTGVAAERLGRDSLLIELNPEYAAIAHRRTMQRGLTLPDQAA